MNVIRNNKVVYSIQSYIRRIKDLGQILSLEDLEIAEFRKCQSKVFSGFVFDQMINTSNGFNIDQLQENPEFISTDKKDINDLIMQTTTVKGNRIRQLEYLQITKLKATNLIDLIHQEYQLK